MPKTANTQRPQVGELNQHEFTAVYRKHRSQIRQFILFMVNDSDLAADLTQDTFVTVYHKLHRHDPAKGSLISWIHRIARNTVFDYLKKPDYRSTSAVSKLWSTDEEAIHYLGICAHCFQPERANEGVSLRSLVGELKHIYREPMELAYFGGLQTEEIAAKLGIPPGLVRNRMHLARKVLAQQLKGRAFVTAAEGQVYAV